MQRIDAPTHRRIELRVEVSPSAPTSSEPAPQHPAPPDTFDVLVWMRRAPGPALPVSADPDPLWQGGLLARFKAPEGSGAICFSLPGTVETLGQSAQLRPFAASPFSSGIWCQFFGDSSRFRCLFAGPPLHTRILKVEEFRILLGAREPRAYLAALEERDNDTSPRCFRSSPRTPLPPPESNLATALSWS